MLLSGHNDHAPFETVVVEPLWVPSLTFQCNSCLIFWSLKKYHIKYVYCTSVHVVCHAQCNDIILCVWLEVRARFLFALFLQHTCLCAQAKTCCPILNARLQAHPSFQNGWLVLGHGPLFTAIRPQRATLI